MSSLTARTLARPSFESAFAPPAFVRAMLAFESALAEAQAAEGLIPQSSASAIASACRGISIDPDALVAWSPNLKVKGKRSFRAQSLIGRGSGEAYQMAFSGQGIVVVQPREDSTDRLRVRG